MILKWRQELERLRTLAFQDGELVQIKVPVPGKPSELRDATVQTWSRSRQRYIVAYRTGTLQTGIKTHTHAVPADKIRRRKPNFPDDWASWMAKAAQLPFGADDARFRLRKAP